MRGVRPSIFLIDAPASAPMSGGNPHKVGGGPVGTPLTSRKCPEETQFARWFPREISPSGTSPLPQISFSFSIFASYARPNSFSSGPPPQEHRVEANLPLFFSVQSRKQQQKKRRRHRHGHDAGEEHSSVQQQRRQDQQE